MRLLSNSLRPLLWLLAATSAALALPTDQQVLSLYQQWSTSLSQAANFNSLASMLSRSACQRIIQLPGTSQQDFFRSIKSQSVMSPSPAWVVHSHLIEGGSLVYVLLNRDNNSRAVLRVIEEDGQLKVDLSPP